MAYLPVDADPVKRIIDLFGKVGSYTASVRPGNQMSKAI
jgi:hypothetical protein